MHAHEYCRTQNYVNIFIWSTINMKQLILTFMHMNKSHTKLSNCRLCWSTINMKQRKDLCVNFQKYGCWSFILNLFSASVSSHCSAIASPLYPADWQTLPLGFLPPASYETSRSRASSSSFPFLLLPRPITYITYTYTCLPACFLQKILYFHL